MTKKIVAISVLCLAISYLFFSKKYTIELTVTKSEIGQDSINKLLFVPVKILNNSNDTLRFLSMSCSWQKFYLVSKDVLKLEIENCDKNILKIITLAPKQSFVNTIKIKVEYNKTISSLNFKVGYNLFKVSSTQNLSNLKFDDLIKRGNEIWSENISL